MNTTQSLTKVSEINKSISGAEVLMNNYLAMHSEYAKFAQSRTNFQIEKFIAMADNTPVNCYVTTLFQTRVMNGELLREVKEATELLREFEYKWKDNTDKNVPIWWHNNDGVRKLHWYDLDKVAHDHRVLEISINIKDKLQQLQFFYILMDKMKEVHGGEFTKLEYEQEAPEYWNARLQKQVFEDLMSRQFGINPGNMTSIITAVAEPILLDGNNSAIEFPNIFKELAAGNFTEVLNLLQGETSARLQAITGCNKNLEQATFESLGVITK